MTDQQVKELLPASPFKIAGRLDFSTGEEEFTVLSMHEILRNNIVQRRTDPITIYSLVGPIGIGRTWSMAWLGRQARYEDMGREDETWEAALVPGIGGGGEIRNLFESIFRSMERLRDPVLEEQQGETEYPVEIYSDEPMVQIMLKALQDRSVWAVFTGNRGRFPSMEGVDEKPRWTNRDTQLEFLALWFKFLEETGIEHVIILLDEMEILATRLSKNKLIDLSDGLRAFFDKLESSAGDVPNIQLIMSLTTEGANRIDPSVGSEEVAGWVQPLQDRMDAPYMLSTIDQDEAKEIARHVIDVKRVEDLEDPYAPYTEEAIERAFEASDGLPRRLSKIFNQMHQIGYNNTTLGVEDAEEAIEVLGLESEELV